ncbi:MAG: SAF domain-containing protein [Chloroflexota bacterium]
MRRGRIFIYLALILIIGLGAAYLYLKNKGGLAGLGTTPTQPLSQVSIVVAGQNIPRGKLIDEGDIITINIPENQLVAGEFTDINLVIGQYAKYPLDQGMIITQPVLVSSAGSLSDAGSTWSALISPGLTAITIPISRLSAVGYGIRDGDHINLIASMLLVDVDLNYQSITPNLTAGLLASNSSSFFSELISGSYATLDSDPDAYNLTAQSVSGLSMSPQGRVELDPNFQEPLYIVPSEKQRARLVTQMVLQNVLVLHVGTFLLPGETEVDLTAEQTTETVQDGTAAPLIQRPDIITLVVTPQEAVTLTYLMNSGVQMTMTLRGPSEDESRVETEAATLQYLLSQYQIPVPSKLPYALEPRLDELVPPLLPNDIITTPAQ